MSISWIESPYRETRSLKKTIVAVFIETEDYHLSWFLDYVLSQCFSGRAYSPTYWAVKTEAGNMLGFNVERNGMPIPSSVATISTSISTAAPNAG